MVWTFNLAKVENHEDWNQQLREHNKLDPWLDFVKIFLERLQGVEDLAWKMVTERDIDNGVGVQLDGIGQIVQEGRNGKKDTVYPAFLKIAILANRCNGQVDSIQEICGILETELGLEFSGYDEETPATLRIQIYKDTDGDLTNEVFRVLSKCVGAGIRFLYMFERDKESNIFRTSTTYGSTTTLDYYMGCGLGSIPTIGGKVAGIYMR